MDELITKEQLKAVVSSLVLAALEGDIRSATVLMSHFVPKVKTIHRPTPYKSIADVRDAYFLGIISADEVVSTLSALNLLKDDSIQSEVIAWNDEMLKYITKKNKESELD